MQKETVETKFESYFLPFSAQIDEKTVISQSGLISQTIALNAELKIRISFQRKNCSTPSTGHWKAVFKSSLSEKERTYKSVL